MTIVDTLQLDDVISLAVLGDMELRISTQFVARQGDHNAATFRIVKQPAALDAYSCRAEIETPAGKNYYLIDDNGEFLLTQDISVPGPGRMQLVYSDGVDFMRKTSVAHFTVVPSINAVDPSDVDFQDGLAQLTQAAFCRVDVNAGVVRFYNYAGIEVGSINLPGGIEDLDGNYLRLNGANQMTGNLTFLNSGNGIIFNQLQSGSIIYQDFEPALRLRKPLGNAPVTIEDNSGAATSRTPIVTEVSGDARYLQRAGGQMSGQIILPTGGGVTNAQLAFGDNATGFYRSGNTVVLSVGGQLYCQWLGSPPSFMMGVPLNMATQRITSLADPIAATDAVPRQYVDAAIAGIPQPPAGQRPNLRAYIPTEIAALLAAPQTCLDINFPVADNSAKTIMVVCDCYFDGGAAGQFYDVIYTCTTLAPGVDAHNAVYRVNTNANSAYMRSPITFGGTVFPESNNTIRIIITVRLGDPAPATVLTQVGQRPTSRSYITVMEMQN